MIPRAILGLAAVLLAVVPVNAAVAGSGPRCVSVFDPSCHTVVADHPQGDFHGLIMVPGQPSVLDLAARSGTQAGCADCEWTVLLACLHNTPGGDDLNCNGMTDQSRCGRHQSLFRLFLTTRAVTNELAAEICLGGIHDIVPVGDLAAADVGRYLHVVHPPDLLLTVQPPNGALAGLPAYFQVRPPRDLAPESFGTGVVTETITIAPLHYVWDWGDGTDATHTDDTGGPYPDGTLTHTYLRGGRFSGTLDTEWGATYTLTVAGETFGPYAATGGLVSHTQQFSIDVAVAHSHLVSH